ncbi:WhiB family transcriptional regulator [Streptomyces sp. NPDC060366]|uniref:WhiB family transcriptional regulator n=1 Tax=Streptomyces sp. NPDC060366 TaxID=3347105 RepID=UPI00364FC504
MEPRYAREALTDHPLYKYRGCGPDEQDPSRSAGDPDVSVDAWAPYTGDIPEPQKVRIGRERAALRICGWCPVRTECAAYANSETVDGHLVEPEGVWGGELALSRHRALIARRAAVTAPGRDMTEARTPQKLAVLRALARETDAELVAYRADMDVRTANWHRSALVTLLGLNRETATRDQMLAAAVEQGLLPRSTRIRPSTRWPDGPWPFAAAPTVDGARQRRIEGRRRRVQLVLPGLRDMVLHRTPPVLRVVIPRPRTGARWEQPLLPDPAPARLGRLPRRQRPAPTTTTVLEHAA